MKHFTDFQEDKQSSTRKEIAESKIVYIRQGNQMTASRIHPVFDKSGLRQKLVEAAKVRYLPENLMYFAKCVGVEGYGAKYALFEVSKFVDPYGYKDLIGIHKIHKRKGIRSPITKATDTATVMCLSKDNGFIDLGDMAYIKLNFVQNGIFPSIGIIQEHQIFSKSLSITRDEIAELRGGLSSDSDA
jgi:hypothetical protein